MKKIKIATKLLSFFMAVLILFYSVPAIVYAESADAISSLFDSEEIETTSSEAKEKIERAYEVEELRTENTKTFKSEDGAFVAAQYPTSVHKLSENGKWEDINNKLNQSGSEYTTSDARIKFAKKITGNASIFTLHENNKKITLALEGANKKTAAKVTNGVDTEKTDIGKLMYLENISSTVFYEDILDGVDIEYVISGNNIKENIIVKERKSEYVYSFVLSLNNLSATLSDSGDVLITDSSNNVCYTIPAPIIYDANGTYADSDVGKYELLNNGNGTYTLTVKAASEWMNDASRAFPITVDPTIYPDNVDQATKDLYISSTYPNASYDTYFEMDVRGNSQNSTSIAYWKIQNMNFLPKTAYIVEASLHLFAISATDQTIVGAYRATSSWSETHTYTKYLSGQGALNSYPMSYRKVHANSTASFDITEAVRLWKNNSSYNHGIGLKIINDTANASAIFGTSESEFSEKPVFTVTYRNAVGLEDYYSYSSHNIGESIGSINIATGNLALTIPTLTTTDALMSYTPTLVYNTAQAGKYFVYPNSQTAFSYASLAYGFKWNIQQTVIKRVEYDATTVNYVDYYIWNDADGTEHAFTADDDGVITDEDGLQLTLTVNGTKLYIEDKDENIMTFSAMSAPNTSVSAAWRLISVTDKNGNRVEFNYKNIPSPQYVKIVPNGESAITMLEIGYGSQSSPIYIANEAANEAVIFKYSNTGTGDVTSGSTRFLREVIYVKRDSAVTNATWAEIQSGAANQNGVYVCSKLEISYTGDNGYISSLYNPITDYRISYSYNGAAIASVTEYGNETVGQTVAYSYYNGYTEIAVSGSDDILSTDDDIITRYVLDNYGRVTSYYSKNADGTILGAASGVYETQENVKNNIKESAAIGGSNASYILNGGFEKLDDEANVAYWEFSGNATRANHSDYDGHYNAVFKFNSERSGSISQELYLKSGTYTISFDLNSYYASNVSVKLKVSSITQNGLIYLTENFYTDGDAVGKESRVCATFDVGAYLNGGDRIIIEISAAGNSFSSDTKVEVDCVSLVPGDTPGAYSLVDGGKFEIPATDSNGGSTIPLTKFWEVSGQSYDFGTVDQTFKTSFKFTPDINGKKFIKQTVYNASMDEYIAFLEGRDIQQNHDYIISGYARSYGAISRSSGAEFCIKVSIGYLQADGTIRELVYRYDLVASCTDWQFVSGSFTTEHENIEGISCELVAYIDLYCEYSNQPSVYAVFDDVSVICCTDGNLQKYEYDERGNLTAKKSFFYSEYYEYDESDNIIRIANDNGEIQDYEYTENGNVESITFYTFEEKIYPTSVSNPDDYITKHEKAKAVYSYNSFGQTTEILKTDSDEHTEIRKGYSYSSSPRIIGALIEETTDDGTVISYFYDESNGNLVATVNETNGEGTAYSYDEYNRISAVRPAMLVQTGYEEHTNAESVRYEYSERNLLESIITETTEYSFVYDSFGNSSSVFVGENNLASYEYNANNGKLLKTIYGNGFSEEYSYNYLELTSEVWYNIDGDRYIAYSYEYTNDGQLSEFKNHLSGEVTVYTYNPSGRLASVVTYDSEDMESDVNEVYFYDGQGRLSSLVYQLGEDMHYNEQQRVFVYNEDGSVSVATLYFNGTHISETGYVYDNLNRLVGIASYNYLWSDNGTRFNSTAAIEYTGLQISGYVSNVEGNGATEYSYEYDANGYISKITVNEAEIRYVYDKLGQLVREDNGQTGFTYVHTYDNAGNITSSAKYVLTPEYEAPTVLISTESYVYSSGTWGDLLTSYNNGQITYDEIGNPLSYYNGAAFAWTGRRLTGATKDGIEYTFTYNDAGIRTSKTKGEETTVYYLSGSTILGEKTGEKLTVYIYDAQGLPMGFAYSATGNDFDVYWYEKNLHGDIVAVYSDAGTKLISYTYDAWGNATISYHNGGEETTAINNPFTYRGYYYDKDLGLYYLQSRYYDSNTGRFISADSYVSTGQGILGNNMFAYCGNNPVMYVDYNGEEGVAATLCTVVGVVLLAALAVTLYEETQNHTIGNLIDETVKGIKNAFGEFVGFVKSLFKSESKAETTTPPSDSEWKTYYHITTPENAALIQSTNIMKGSDWEGGYIFAWKTKPNKVAAANSGAHMGVVISFETKAAFSIDKNFDNSPSINAYGPVMAKGPIIVRNVTIVEIVDGYK